MADPKETGFGSPIGPTTPDAGFGSPLTAPDAGFGSPLITAGISDPAWFLFPIDAVGVHWLPPSIWNAPSGLTYPTRGGEVVVIVNLIGFSRVKGWYVQLIAQSDGQVYPSLDRGCFSAEFGQGDDCWTNLAQDSLAFTLPTTVAGVYDVRVTNTHSGFDVTLTGAITTAPGSDSETVDHMAASIMCRWAGKARTEAPMPPMRAFIETIGRQLDTLAGRPSSRLVADFGPSDTSLTMTGSVGWPSQAAFYSRGERYTYSGRVGETLTGVAHAELMYRYLTIPAGDTIILDVKSLPPSDGTFNQVVVP